MDETKARQLANDIVSKMTPEQIAQIDAILSGKLPMSKIATKSPLFVDSRKYWRVTHGLFETIVDGRDAASRDAAIDEAFNNTKQSWYRTAKIVGECNVEEWNHTQFVEWLRK